MKTTKKVVKNLVTESRVATFDGRYLTAKELLNETKKRIKESPEDYCQETFCGQAVCLGGHMDNIINGPRSIKTDLRIDQDSMQEFLLRGMGVNPYDLENALDGFWLFQANFEGKFEQDYDNAKTSKAKAKVGIAAINYFMENPGQPAPEDESEPEEDYNDGYGY